MNRTANIRKIKGSDVNINMAMKLTNIGRKELINLRRKWRLKIEDLKNGKNWVVNSDECKAARATKAEAIEACIIDLNYLLRQSHD